MMRFLTFLALFVTTAALADAPVIWSGTTAKWLPNALHVAGMCKTDAAGTQTAYTTNGIIKMSSGVPGAAVAGTDFVAATSGSAIQKANGAGGLTAATGDTDYQNPITLATFGSAPSASGASFSGDTLTIQPADATHPGSVTTGAQTFAGAKTFSSTIVGSVNGNAATVTTNANMTGPITGTGNVTSVTAQTGTGTTFVMDTSPTLVTPVLGVAAATSINKVAITAPATSATLTIANGKTLTSSNTLTLAGTDGSTLNVGTGGTLGTLAFLSDPLAVNKGGTGLATLTAHALQVGAGTSTPVQLGPSSSTAFPLVAGGSSADPSFALLTIAGGGTGQTTAAAAFSALSPITTTGDIIYSSSGTTNTRLAIGSTGNVLTVAGGVPTWAAPSGSVRSEIYADTGNGEGGSVSGETKIRNFSNVRKNTGSDITYTARTTTTGDFFTINKAGVYCVSYTDGNNTQAAGFAITVNSSATSTDEASITYAQGKRANSISAAGFFSNASWCGILAASDIVRGQVGGTVTDFTTDRVQFSIVRVN